MSDVLKADQLLSFREAHDQLAGKPHHTTLQRWATVGVNGVVLRTVKVGARRFIPLAALDEFIAALNA